MSKKRRAFLLIPLALMLLCSVCFQRGYHSGSANADLYDAMVELHGPPYGGKFLGTVPQDGGDAALYETLTFSVEPPDGLVLRPWLANALGRPYYAFRCEAVYARWLMPEKDHVTASGSQVWTYEGWDDCIPNSTRRAWIDPDSGTVRYDGDALFEDAGIS